MDYSKETGEFILDETERRLTGYPSHVSEMDVDGLFDRVCGLQRSNTGYRPITKDLSRGINLWTALERQRTNGPILDAMIEGLAEHIGEEAERGLERQQLQGEDPDAIE